MGNYTIKSGDTGYGIAKALGVDFSKLAAANPQVKNWDNIMVGNSLNVPTLNETFEKASTPIKPGAYYVNYPDYNVSINDEKDLSAPLGHAGVYIVDNDGNHKYYEYGRYKGGIGAVNEDSFKGNWTQRNIPNAYRTDMESISEYLLSQQNAHGQKTSKARFTYVPDVDVAAVEQYVLNDANNPNRKDYTWSSLFNSKSCGSEACAAIEQGYKAEPSLKKTTKNIKSSIVQTLFKNSPASSIINLLSGKGISIPSPIDSTPQEFEENWTSRGYKTYTYDQNN